VLASRETGITAAGMAHSYKGKERERGWVERGWVERE
jgi:hypothetical protein